MKRLCLIRHGKTNWDHPLIEDKERPLDERGEADSVLMAESIKAHKVKPAVILTSPAKRALDTAMIIAKTLGVDDQRLIVDDRIYEAGVEELLAIIQAMDNHYQTVIVIGHNPGLTLLANYLADDHVINLPTCGTYCVDFDTDDWANITKIEGKTLFVDSPKHQPLNKES